VADLGGCQSSAAGIPLCSAGYARGFIDPVRASRHWLVKTLQSEARGNCQKYPQLKSIVTRAELISIHAGFSDPKYPHQSSVQGRVVLHLPASFPFLSDFQQVSLSLGASPG
jgi:hypothetical protein